MKVQQSLTKTIRFWILFFIIFLAASGMTAFALDTELSWLDGLSWVRESGAGPWIRRVGAALHQTNMDFPFLAYGYDWLAFAHLVIAVAFIGPIRDPVRNKWVIQFGMIACCMIFPLACIAGHVRGIPFFWQLIDCSFGVLGMIPLWICYRKIEQLEKLTTP